MWFLLLLFMPVGEACNCAPLASCIQHANGSWGCLCPYYGDGYSRCEEQRFVTDVVVRTKAEIQPWLAVFASARVSHMSQRKLLSETQYVLEFDSTNYEAMLSLTEQINLKGWPYQVAVMGSATSRVVQSASFEEIPPLLEIVNISYNDSWWKIELVANRGMIFVSNDISPLPCIHVQTPCCVMDYMYSPFHIGYHDMNSSVRKCTLPTTNVSQSLSSAIRKLTSHIYVDDEILSINIHSDDLSSIASSDTQHYNFSVGLLNSDFAATQVFVSLSKTFTGYSVGTFTRQVATFVMMQVERVDSTHYIRCWAHLTLTNATVVYVQYAWEEMDWIQPACVKGPPACFDVPEPCRATTNAYGMLEIWVPVENYNPSMGNLSLYFVVRQDKTLARVMTQSKPDVVTVHCQESTFSDNFEVQIMQGLQLKQIYRGPVLQVMPLNVEPQTDTLITLVVRSMRGAAIEELKAVHTRTEAERELVNANKPCPTCVTEQLVLAGKAVSTRSCFVFGGPVGNDASRWIQNYVGLVGSTLAFDILSRLPADIGTAAAAWVNPVWPWGVDEEIKSVTFLHAKFGRPSTRTGRRLLEFNSHHTLKAQWCMVASVALLLMLWHFYQSMS